MKKVFNIIFMLMLIFVFTSCKGKYSTIYCDFDAGDFESKGYYYLRTTDEVSKFNTEHNVTSEFKKKLDYDSNFFNSKFLIVLIMPEELETVSYKIESVTYKNSTLEVVIKQLNKSDSTTNPDDNKNPTVDTNPGGTTDDGSNNESNNDGEGSNGSIMDNNNHNNSVIDNIGDSIMDNGSSPSNGSNTDNNGNNEGTNPDDNNGSNEGTNPDDNNGNNNNNPNDGNGTQTKTLVNKAYIFEFKKNNTVTKINFKIV